MKTLEVEKLSFAYRDRPVLQNISFYLEQGDILSLLGPNGSGKTTLLNCLTNFLSDYKGEIYMNGQPIRTLSAKKRATMIAYVPQLTTLSFNYTVREFVVMGRCSHMGFFARPKEKDYTMVEEKLSMLNIGHLKERGMDRLSGGERQLVYIARALVQEPELILLDEPTSALDYSNSRMVLKIIRKLSKRGYTLVLTCHNPEYPLLLGGKTGAIFKDMTFLWGTNGCVITDQFLSRLYGFPIHIEYLEKYDQYVCVGDV